MLVMIKYMDIKLRQFRVRGSAMTEFAVLTLAMLPIMVGIPMIGKMIDLKQTAINASRYAAWEATISDSSVQSNQIESRFFGDELATLSTNGSSNSNNKLWGESRTTGSSTYFGQSVVQIVSGSAVVDSQAIASSPSSANPNDVGTSFGSVVKKAGSTLSWAPGTDWGVSENGLISASVQIKVKANALLDTSKSACYEQGRSFSCMTAANSIMVDNWSASSDYQSARRTRSFVPTTTIRDVSDMLATSGNLPVLKELKGLKRKNGKYGFGHVDMTPLPRPLGTYPK